MRVLIIGSKGMLGQYLAQVFESEELFLWDRTEIDITNFEEVKNKILSLKPDLVINSAAYNAVDQAEENWQLALAVNTKGPEYLAKVCQVLDILLIHYSSDYVFSGQRELGYIENDLAYPLSNYGRSKYLGELAVQSNCSKYYLIRLSKLFGLPALSEGAKKSFVDLMLQLSETKKELEVIDEELSSPTYALHLAQRTKDIFKNQEKFGIYHLANSDSCTWYEFAQEVFKIKNKEIKVIPVSSKNFQRQASRPKFSTLLNTKLKPMPSWRDALREYLKNPSDFSQVDQP